MIRAQIHAFDKDSSANYSKSLAFETREQLDAQFKEFDQEVPFSRWYYELEADDILTPEQETIINEFND